jgi:putative endonuclease
MPREYHFYVYMVQSSSRRALYIGMTNSLRRRVFEHKSHRTEGFTDQYNAVRLVYWERYDDVYKAIAREKQLKNWRREKKLWLIARFNPGWKDLAEDWYETAPVVDHPLGLAAASKIAENTRSLDLPSLSLGTALGMTDRGAGQTLPSLSLGTALGMTDMEGGLKEKA